MTGAKFIYSEIGVRTAQLNASSGECGLNELLVKIIEAVATLKNTLLEPGRF